MTIACMPANVAPASLVATSNVSHIVVNAEACTAATAVTIGKAITGRKWRCTRANVVLSPGMQTGIELHTGSVRQVSGGAATSSVSGNTDAFDWEGDFEGAMGEALTITIGATGAFSGSFSARLI